MTNMQSLLLCSMLAITGVACRPSEPEPPAAATPSTTESTATEPSATGSTATDPTATGSSAAEPTTADAPSDEVAYEPAYPADVSSEGLSEEDVAQQDAGQSPAGHSHGGEAHSHDEGEDATDHDHEQ